MSSLGHFLLDLYKNIHSFWGFFEITSWSKRLAVTNSYLNTVFHPSNQSGEGANVPVGWQNTRKGWARSAAGKELTKVDWDRLSSLRFIQTQLKWMEIGNKALITLMPDILSIWLTSTWAHLLRCFRLDPLAQTSSDCQLWGKPQTGSSWERMNFVLKLFCVSFSYSLLLLLSACGNKSKK